jgi:hypothetical protein
MKKKIIIWFLAATLAIGIFVVPASAAEIGVLNYSVSAETVKVGPNNTGVFTITVPKPGADDNYTKYGGVEIAIQLPAGTTLDSVSYNLPRGVRAFAPQADSSGLIWFSNNAESNEYADDMICAIYVNYTGTNPVTIKVHEVAQYFFRSELDPSLKSIDKKVSDPVKQALITLERSSTDPPPPPGTPPPGGDSGMISGGAVGGGTVDNGTGNENTSSFPFTDVKESDWFYSDVYYMWENKLMNGTGETLFDPGAMLTRGMIVTVLYRMQGSPDAAALPMPFSDVANIWYYDAIKWAAINKIALGFENGTFHPNENVTREQMAAFLFRYSEYTETDLPDKEEFAGFADQASIASYALGYVEALVKADIIRGKENNRFDPKGNAIRAEYAAVLHRFLQIGGE